MPPRRRARPPPKLASAQPAARPPAPAPGDTAGELEAIAALAARLSDEILAGGSSATTPILTRLRTIAVDFDERLSSGQYMPSLEDRRDLMASMQASRESPAVAATLLREPGYLEALVVCWAGVRLPEGAWGVAKELVTFASAISEDEELQASPTNQDAFASLILCLDADFALLSRREEDFAGKLAAFVRWAILLRVPRWHNLPRRIPRLTPLLIRVFTTATAALRAATADASVWGSARTTGEMDLRKWGNVRALALLLVQPWCVCARAHQC